MKRYALGQIAKRPANAEIALRRIFAEDAYLTGGWADKPEQQLDQRRLAGAIVADERDGLAFVEGEREFPQRINLAAISFRNPFDANGRGHGHCSFRTGIAISGWLSVTPPGRSAGNRAWAQRTT
ncbi:hypothetical protein D9M68_915560 [compost metagenome]